MQTPEHPLNLEGNPFSPEENAAFYFTPPPIAQRLDLIQYLVEYSGQVLLVIGEHGSGKTAMLRQLLAKAGELWRTCHIEATPMLDARALQQRLAGAFGLMQVGADLNRYLDSLQAQLDACERSNLRPVLCVDDAHELPADSLTLLFSLAKSEEQHGRLHIVLFCEPQIHTMLSAPQLRSLKQNIMHVVNIQGFTAAQTRDYLEQLWESKGIVEKVPFRQKEILRFQSESQGLPGRINSLARQALEGGGSSSEQGTGELSWAPLLRHKWRLLTLAGVLALGSLVIVINSITEAPEEPSQETTVPLALPPPSQTPTAQAPDKLAGVHGHEGAPAPVTPNAAAKPQEPKPKSPVPPLPGAAKNLASPVHKTEAAAPPTPPGGPANAKDVRSQPPRAPPPLATPPAVARVVNPAPTNELPGMHGEDWLRAQQPRQFVLQLFGSHDKNALGRFLSQYKLRGDVAWFATQRNQKSWFVLVYGPFADRNQAIAAISSLPEGVQALKPWARSVSAVHALLSAPP